ncbi:hypothetical protein G0U57_018920, partial [Chelydra serpentina]
GLPREVVESPSLEGFLPLSSQTRSTPRRLHSAALRSWLDKALAGMI